MTEGSRPRRKTSLSQAVKMMKQDRMTRLVNVLSQLEMNLPRFEFYQDAMLSCLDRFEETMKTSMAQQEELLAELKKYHATLETSQDTQKKGTGDTPKRSPPRKRRTVRTG